MSNFPASSPQALFRLRKNYGKTLSVRYSVLSFHLKTSPERNVIKVFWGFQNHFSEFLKMNCIALSKETLMDIQRYEHGTTPADLKRLLQDLDRPRVAWQVLLRQFIRTCRGEAYSWMRPNRRYVAHGVYLPGRQDKIFHGIVALDTSGSTVKALPRFTAELAGLLKSFGKNSLTILECDATIQHVWTVSCNDPMPDLEKYTFKGGGGTNFTPAFKYISNQKPNRITQSSGC